MYILVVLPIDVTKVQNSALSHPIVTQIPFETSRNGQTRHPARLSLPGQLRDHEAASSGGQEGRGSPQAEAGRHRHEDAGAAAHPL